jgi:hypothetical protein
MPSASSTGISILFQILHSLDTKLKRDALKNDLAIALEEPIKNARKSTDEMLYALYLLGGATLMGLYYEPIDPEKGATEIVTQFFKSYQKFINSCRELTRYLNIHLEEIRDLLNSQEIIAIEAFIESLKNDNVDFKFLYGHGTFKELVVDEYEREKQFPAILSAKLGEEISKSPSLSGLMEMVNFTDKDTLDLILQITSELALKKMVNKDE